MNQVHAQRRQLGFTIVELLIVIVVIGILAAIVVAAFNGITSSAKETSLKNDLSNAKKALDVDKASRGAYPINSSQLSGVTTAIKINKDLYDTTANNFYYCINTVTGEYAMGARLKSNAAAYLHSSTVGLRKVSSVNGDDVCQEVGLSGYADANAFISNGYANNAGAWSSWVK